MEELPTNKELHAAIDHGDVLSCVIKGHGEIETALKAAIAEALAEPHEIELRQASFPFKVDLAVALRVLPAEVRPLLLGLNKLRNRFAHDSRASFDDRDARDLIGLIPEPLLKGVEGHLTNADAKKALQVAFVVAFFQVRGAAERVQEHKRRRKAWLQEVNEYLEENDRLRKEGKLPPLPPEK